MLMMLHTVNILDLEKGKKIGMGSLIANSSENKLRMVLRKIVNEIREIINFKF